MTVPNPILEYDDLTHTYKVDGVVYPSVTQVLTEAGFIDPTWFTEEGAERGSRIASVTEWHDTGVLNEVAFVEAYPNEVGYLEAWKQFLSDRVGTILGIEERVYQDDYCFAGTLDRRVWLLGGVVKTVIDIKTGAKAWWHRYQTAAYMDCCEGAVGGRMAVYLKSNGTYTCDPHDNYTHDIDVFRAALCVANELRAHGKTGDRYCG